MKVGDTIDIEMFGPEGTSLFGRISQKVVAR
jgi:fumarylacetoacetate (FAA) hydrolase